MPLEIKLRTRSASGDTHSHTAVFVGEEGQTLALAGNLCFRVGEFQLFGAALSLGARQTQGHLTVTFVEEGDEKCA